MPEAEDSHSTDANKLHPFHLMDALDDISAALLAYRVMLTHLLSTRDGMSERVAYGTGQLLDFIIERIDAKMVDIEKLMTDRE